MSAGAFDDRWSLPALDLGLKPRKIFFVYEMDKYNYNEMTRYMEIVDMC